MSTKDKLIERFLSLPRDFSFDELTRLMGGFGYTLSNKGATSGSRVSFDKGDESLTIHRPHPGNTVGKGVLKSVDRYLKTKGLV
jgi:hypothetical protein